MPSALLVIKRQAQMTRGLHDVEPQRQVGVRATQLPLANCETLKNYPDFYAQVCSCGKLNSVSNSSSRIQGIPTRAPSTHKAPGTRISQTDSL